MSMKDYQTIVVGTDGSALADPTVRRAAWLARQDDADLVIVCSYSHLPRRVEAKNVATLGGDISTGHVLGREAASGALSAAVKVASDEGATVAAALLVVGEAAMALVTIAKERGADLVVLGALRDRSLATRLLGSTAEEVTKRLSCDVLLVRPVDGAAELEVPESAS